MSVAPESIPRVAPDRARKIAADQFALCGELAALPSERDQNFLISTPQGRFVLKIGNREDGVLLLDFQHRAMRRVAAVLTDCRVPEVVPSVSGAEVVTLEEPDGARHCVRVMRFIEGELLGACRRPASMGLLQSIGAVMARVDRALADFTHPAMHRTLQWDLKQAALAREHLPLLPPTRRARVARLFAEWSAIDWDRLPHGVIHGDANDNNLLVERDRMVGLLDFGDMLYSATVCDLAIAIAYSVLHQPDPLVAMGQVIRGYHRHRPLVPAEQRALHVLVGARLAASVCLAALNRARHPDDPYQVISEAPAWQLLDALEHRSGQEIEACVRAACSPSG